jgi:hypothetical protein
MMTLMNVIFVVALGQRKEQSALLNHVKVDRLPTTYRMNHDDEVLIHDFMSFKYWRQENENQSKIDDNKKTMRIKSKK